MILQPLLKLWSLIKASGFLLKLIRNYAVIKDSFSAVEQIFSKMKTEERKLPSQEESILLLQAASNLMKTGVIDIDGFDEYELSLELDQFASSLLLSIQDKKSDKFHSLILTPKKEQ